MIFILLLLTHGYGTSKEKERRPDKRHSISINPVKPFMGLLNVEYGYELRSKFGSSLFLEYRACSGLIPLPSGHPDFVSTLGVGYYPMTGEGRNNHGVFVRVVGNYVLFKDSQTGSNGFGNGINLGYKWLLEGGFCIQARGILNYTYKDREILPGFGVLIGYVL